MKLELFNEDCMEVMARYPDNYFDLAIVDPPYGIARFGNRVDPSHNRSIDNKINQWDVAPKKEYFDELFRVSVNQLIWGANNFTLPNTEYFCFWDKEQTVDNFASAEYCWVSMGLKKPAKVFRHSIHKTMQSRKSEGGKIHPTQKPIELYTWQYSVYAKKGMKILDTHLGSGSNTIAAYNMNMGEFVGCELDKDYFEAAKKRIDFHLSQQKLF